MITTYYSTLTVPKWARWLALGAVAGPILFTLAWFVLGFVSPGYQLWDLWIAPYSPVSQPVSGLGLGRTSLLMNTAFVLTGILLIVGAGGIFYCISGMESAQRRLCALLLALPGIGTIMDGIFTLESVLLHFTGFALALTPIITFLGVGLLLRRVPHWKRFGNWLLLGSPLTLLLTILFFATFNPETAGANLGIAGLTERILLIELLAWYVLMGWKAFRQPG